MNMNLVAKPWLIPCIIIVVVVVIIIIIILFGFVSPCMKNNWNETHHGHVTWDYCQIVFISFINRNKQRLRMLPILFRQMDQLSTIFTTSVIKLRQLTLRKGT